MDWATIEARELAKGKDMEWSVNGVPLSP